jgi:hypothetical protein
MKNNLTNSSRNKNLKKSVLVSALKSSVSKKLALKFQSTISKFNIKLVNDIIYNEKANIVGKFKDYLIFDDTSEFLKRYYKVKETRNRLPKIYEFYSSYSKIFPNYITISEAKYIYKNIQKKQKMIDKQQRNVQKENSQEKDKKDKIFNTKLYNSLMNLTLYSYHKNSILNSTHKFVVPTDNSEDSLENMIVNLNNAEEFTNRILLSSNVSVTSFERKVENIDKKPMNKKASKLNLVPSEIKDTVEEKTVELGTSKAMVGHKPTVSVPKLPISTINNHIYNNFNIINNYQVQLSPKVNSSRTNEKKLYNSNNTSNKNIPITNRKEEYKSNNPTINKLMPKIIDKQETVIKNISKNLNKVQKSTSQTKKVQVEPAKKTLKTTYSTKNLLLSSTNINLKQLAHSEIVSIPQTARQKVDKSIKLGKR